METRLPLPGMCRDFLGSATTPSVAEGPGYLFVPPVSAGVCGHVIRTHLLSGEMNVELPSEQTTSYSCSVPSHTETQ